MRGRDFILATLLILAPFGATAADLVVWWEKGSHPGEDEAVREIITAFEQDSGKQVELVLHGQYEVGDQTSTALKAGHAPDFLYLSLGEWITQWAYEGKLVDLEAALGPVLDLFDADAVEVAMLLNGGTGRRGLYGLPMGRRSNHLHVWRPKRLRLQGQSPRRAPYPESRRAPALSDPCSSSGGASSLSITPLMRRRRASATR